MDKISPPGPQHEHFITWAKDQGIEINSVGPAKIHGSGLGIIAQRKIEAGETLVSVPFSALLTANSVPKEMRHSHADITIHGLLASFLAFGSPENGQCDVWKASWPSLQDFEESMPILWPEALRGSLDRLTGKSTTRGAESSFFPLPPGISGHWSHPTMQEYCKPGDGPLTKQENKLKKAWEIVSKVFPHESFQKFLYYWLVVNTRSFYYELPGIPVPQSSDDCMVLCPFVEYFNHQDSGCNVTFSEKGYTVTSDRAYDAGEEIFVSYGGHSNDFLLVEYGFFLEKNKWDSLVLDQLLLSRLDSDCKNRLKDAGYLGNYTLNSEGACHRTQVAVRTQMLDQKRWKRFVAGLDTHDDQDEPKADSFIAENILLAYYEEAETAIKHLEKLEMAGVAGPRAVLIRRWHQIRDLVREAFRNGIHVSVQSRMHRDFGVLPP